MGWDGREKDGSADDADFCGCHRFFNFLSAFFCSNLRRLRSDPAGVVYKF